MATARQSGLRALVIGGGGFIGSHVAERLRSHASVTVLTRRPAEDRRAGIDEIVGDASGADVLAAAMADVNVVVFAAAGLMPGDAEREPMFNLEQVMRPLIAMTEALAARPNIHVVFLSSGGTVYGRPHQLPIPETHPLEPISEYGLSKLLAERKLMMMADRIGFPLTILRCANVYGPRQAIHKRQGIVGVFMERLLNRKPITIFGDGGVVRDFVYVGDVADVVDEVTRGTVPSSVYNVGTGTGTSVKEVVDLLAEVAGIEPVIHQEDDRPFDIPQSVLDVAKLQTVLDFHPTTLRDGLTATWAWFSAQAGSA